MALTAIPSMTASPMSFRCSVRRVETVPSVRAGIAANASARAAAARRAKKAAPTAGDPPSSAAPSPAAGTAATDAPAGGEDDGGAAALALPSTGGPCSGSEYAALAGFPFFAGARGFLRAGRGSGSEATGVVGEALAGGVATGGGADGGAGAAGGAGDGTGAGSGAGCATADPTAPRVIATAIDTTTVFAGPLPSSWGKARVRPASAAPQGLGAQTGRRGGSGRESPSEG